MTYLFFRQQNQSSLINAIKFWNFQTTREEKATIWSLCICKFKLSVILHWMMLLDVREGKRKESTGWKRKIWDRERSSWVCPFCDPLTWPLAGYIPKRLRGLYSPTVPYHSTFTPFIIPINFLSGFPFDSFSQEFFMFIELGVEHSDGFL